MTWNTCSRSRSRPGEGPPQEGTPEFDAEMARWGALNEEMRQAGVAVGASGLHVDATTTVRAIRTARPS